jgi:transcriptional regulator with XRE-family HTH domain
LNIKNTISRQLKEACYVRRQTVKELSEEVGLSYTSFNTYANGKSEPKASFFLAMYKAGFNIAWLITGEGNMYRSDNIQDAPDDLTDNLSVSTPSLQSQKQSKLIQNYRKDRMLAFIHHWFDKESSDEQVWLEMQLGRSVPEYKSFISSKETARELQKSMKV